MERFTIGGVAFLLSKSEVERKLNGVEPEPVHEVYVEVSGTRYPIKQALMASTGLLRGGFTTHDAMRVFRKLGLRIGSEGIDPKTMPERCYTMLKSVNEFDKMEAYDGKAFAGVWRGNIDNFPGVTMVISDEGTELSGAVLFYLVRRDEGQPPKATPGDPEPMFNIKLNGNLLNFQVSHRRAHPPRTIHDPPITFHLKLTVPDQGVLIRGQEENSPFLVLRDN